ncbi:MAG TPA: multicopper oxidase domain-containing protein [Pyrinomonadaceae bacterium]|jgi:FtsP/CotA-like multicopper oxidase with cupredoxin domain|nr:multicopper oxidase domain-containing protein [Pyrinomonadaceae bacterium]
MANISKINRRAEKEQQQAARNRREIIPAGLSRREMLKMGLLTSAGLLVPMSGLSVRARTSAGHLFGGGSSGSGSGPSSPPTTPFVQPFTRMTVKQPVATLNPVPTASPNTAAGEGRTKVHQAFSQFPATRFYEVEQRLANIVTHPELPLQPLWGFDGLVPGPLYVERYGRPILVRNHNNLPLNNGGFGKNLVTTHLHNGHTPSESDGNPCDFFPAGKFYDQHYPNVLAGVNSTHQATGGDIQEAMSTLWYHDHMHDFTSQNVYKGLAGMYLLFNDYDTGDETTGFHLPSFGDGVSDDSNFDVPMLFSDHLYDSETGIVTFDTFNFDGVLGDRFLVNGKVQPVMHVHPRRYRFRWLDAGPSRFYQFFFTDTTNLNQRIKFHQISTDGNLLDHPVEVESVRISVAERADVIIDFSKYAGKTLYIENRLEQQDGRGPTGKVLAAGQGNLILKIVVDLPPIADNSVDPATITRFYGLPDKTATPRITRTFNFDRSNGNWTINGRAMDPECQEVRARISKNSVEHWIVTNSSGGWQHPAHIHFEEFQFLSVNGAPPASTGLVLNGRKDVIRLEHNMQTKSFFRFRDFTGRYPFHCHNVVHEDHAMMLIWEIVDGDGDNVTNP